LRSDWSLDPYKLTEKDGFFYGRGTSDIKDGSATLAEALLRLKRNHVVPQRTLILALTAGEEGGGGYNGMDWLLKNHRDLIDAVLDLDSPAVDIETRTASMRSRWFLSSQSMPLYPPPPSSPAVSARMSVRCGTT